MLNPRATTAIAACLIAVGAIAVTAGAHDDHPVHQAHDRDRDNRPILTVTGQGTVAVAPDRAVVRVGATHQATEAGLAQGRVNAIVEETTDAIRDLDIEGLTIRTTGLSLMQRQLPGQGANARNTPEIQYRSSLTIEVRIDDVTRTGDVIDAALASGANQLQGVTFTLKDDADAERRALQAAVREARGKANAMATALGTRVERVVELRETSNAPFQPFPGGGMRTMQAVAPTPIESGELEINATVEITYRLAR